MDVLRKETSAVLVTGVFVMLLGSVIIVVFVIVFSVLVFGAVIEYMTVGLGGVTAEVFLTVVSVIFL